MRVLWCMVVVMTLLAPLGSAGITIVPQDGGAQLTAPHTRGGLATIGRRELDDMDAAALLASPARAPAPPCAPGAVQRCAAPLAIPPRVEVGPLGSRAPPA